MNIAGESGPMEMTRVRPDGLAVWTFESPADTSVHGGFAIAPAGSRAAFVRPVPGESDETPCDDGGEVVILDLQTGALNPVPHTVGTVGGDSRLSSPTGLIWAGETLYASHPVTGAGFESDIRLGCSDNAPHTLWAWENAWTSIDVGYDNVALGVPTSSSTMILSEFYEALNAHDWDRLAATMSVDVVRIGMQDTADETCRGKQRYLEYVKSVIGKLEHHTMRIVRVFYSTDGGHASAETVEEIRPPGGQTTTFHCLNSIEIDEDGLIAGFDLYQKATAVAPPPWITVAAIESGAGPD